MPKKRISKNDVPTPPQQDTPTTPSLYKERMMSILGGKIDGDGGIMVWIRQFNVTTGERTSSDVYNIGRILQGVYHFQKIRPGVAPSMEKPYTVVYQYGDQNSTCSCPVNRNGRGPKCKHIEAITTLIDLNKV